MAARRWTNFLVLAARGGDLGRDSLNVTHTAVDHLTQPSTCSHTPAHAARTCNYTSAAPRFTLHRMRWAPQAGRAAITSNVRRLGARDSIVTSKPCWQLLYRPFLNAIWDRDGWRHSSGAASGHARFLKLSIGGGRVERANPPCARRQLRLAHHNLRTPANGRRFPACSRCTAQNRAQSRAGKTSHHRKCSSRGRKPQTRSSGSASRA